MNWFKSYLSDRTQVTKCENTILLTTRAVTISVPQGSTLGTLLLILFVNDLYHIKHIFNVSLKMYADDTVIYAHGNSILEVRTILQSCMDYVYKWCITNRLYMNMKKTKIMWFENNSQLTEGNSNYTIDINGVSLSRVYSYLYLGVDLDHTLSYDKYLDNVSNKTTQKLNFFPKDKKIYYRIYSCYCV